MAKWPGWRWALVTTATWMMVAAIAWAQTQEGGSQGGTGAGGGTGGAGVGTGGTAPPGREAPTPTIPTQPGQQRTPFPTEQPQPFPEIQRPIFLQGRVVFEDGTPAPPNVVIERVCHGQPIPEAYTDSKGRFSFQVGQNQHIIPDASISSGMGQFPTAGSSQRDPFGSPTAAGRAISERDLMGCELRASLPGYRSSTVELTGRRMFDNPDVGTIVLYRLANVEGLTISFTSLKAPNNAKKAFQQGVKQASERKWANAQKQLEKAVQLYPEYAEAWNALGQVYEAQKQPDQARQAYQKAIECDPKFVPPYVRLAVMDARESKWEKVLETTEYVLRMNPYDFPEVYFYNAVAHLNLRHPEEAEKAAREALKLKADRRFPQVEHVLGLALALQNNFAEARQHLQRYMELAPNAANLDVVKQQLAQIEALMGAAPRPGGSVQ